MTDKARSSGAKTEHLQEEYPLIEIISNFSFQLSLIMSGRVLDFGCVLTPVLDSALLHTNSADAYSRNRRNFVYFAVVWFTQVKPYFIRNP